MKKIVICVLLLAFSALSFSQPVNRPVAELKSGYLEKSKKQKTTAWLLAGGGSALMLTGALIPLGEYTSSGNLWEDIWGGGSYKNDEVKSAFWLTGFLSMLGSIPLFVASRSNKKKGMSLSFKNEPGPHLPYQRLARRPVPSLNFTLSL